MKINNISIGVNNPNLNIDINNGKIHIHGVSKESFKELKNICNHYDKNKGTEWVVCCGITFFFK